MTDAEYDRWVAGLRIRGDEAFLPGERIRGWKWRRLTTAQRRHYHRDRSRRLRANAAYREREREKRRARDKARRERTHSR